MADVLNIARGQLGVTESPAGSNRTKYGKWMGLDGQPWCMSFVQWCFHQAGTPLPHKTGSCSALLNWYLKNRPDCVMKDPQPGDIAIFTFGHTGIVERALPWLTAMVGLPWTAHGTVCAFYLNMAKSDHKEGGIAFETARAAGFQKSGNSPVQGFRLHGAVLRFWVCCTYRPSYAWTGQQQMA